MNVTAQKTFGKRGRLPASAPAVAAPAASLAKAAPARDALALSSAGIPLAELAASLRTGELSESALGGQHDRSGGKVPTSFRAAVLTGIVVGFLQAGFDIVQAQHSQGMTHALALVGIAPGSATPWLIAGSLWSGAEAAGSTILLAHRLLKRLSVTSFAAYAGGGAVAAGVISEISQLLGLGAPSGGLALQVAAGFAAGLCYRLFAGNRARSALLLP